MKYEGAVYRPPSEAYSLIIQVTIGCSHNRCSFCNMYKDKQFRLRPLSEILADLESCRLSYRKVERIFLADGDALIMPTSQLIQVLQHCRRIFPECNRIGIYATPFATLRKSGDELALLYQEGLTIAYLGVESGSDQVLERIHKGATQAQIVEAGQKIKKAGLQLSITLISGLGGKDLWEVHAQESGVIMDLLQPDFVGLLTLLVEPGTELFEQQAKGEFIALTPLEILAETHLMLENVYHIQDCIFRSNHASNYLALAGTLCQDKQALLDTIEKVLKNPDCLPNKPHRQL